MRLAVIVTGLIAGLYGVDKFLASQEQTELRQDAARVFQHGTQLLNAGKARESIADFARAHALERGNREYLLALANAQLTAGDVNPARATLDDALQDDSNDGRANLLMARAAMAAGKFSDGDSFYHRAIYGTWAAAKDDRNRARVRLELADLLARRGAKGELLSELLLLQNEPADPARQEKVAELFLQAGSPTRAADAYHALIKQNPDDAEALEGLGKAEIANGNYALAVSAYRAALRLKPEDETVRGELSLSEHLTALDPSSRRLSAEERKRRNLAILTAVESCVGASEEQVDDDEVLENAERLWKSHGEKCTGNPEPFDLLPLLMRKLGQ